MLRRKHLILFTTVLAIAVLFTAPAVMAEWPEPQPIYDNLPMETTINVFKGGEYKVTAEVVPGVTEDGITGDQYKLTFSAISGSILSITRVYLTTPRWVDPKVLPAESLYCSEPLSVLFTSSDWQRNQNTEALWEARGRDVMQWTAMSTDGIWSLIADKIEVEDLVPGTICIGENRYVGCGELAVLDCPRPDCPSPTYVGPQTSGFQCMTIDSGAYPMSVLYRTVTQTGYVDGPALRFFRSPDCKPCEDCDPADPEGGNPPTSDPDSPNIFCTTSEGGKNQCLRYDSASPGSATYYILGVPYTFYW